VKKKSLSWIISAVIAFSMLTGCVYHVRTPPPQPKVEVRPAQPYERAVWIEGYWTRTRGDWAWVQGHWESTPGPESVWVRGHWKKTWRGWKRVPGHWRRVR